MKKKVEKKQKTIDLQLREFLKNLSKNYTNFQKTKLNKLAVEENQNIISLNDLENKIQDICFEKYTYINKLINLDKKVKEEVEKYSNFFNIEKYVNKQNLQIKKLNKKIITQEDNVISTECIICMENERNVVFLPCMHLITCKKCGFDLIKKDCPKCSSIIEKREVIEM